MKSLLLFLAVSANFANATVPSAEDLMGDADLVPLFWADILDRDIDEIVNGSISYDNAEVVILGGLNSQGYGFSFCSGTLISNRWVVTAAHCVDGVIDQYEAWGYDIFVASGTNVFVSGYDAFAWVKRAVAHPDYNSNNLQHDIGLLELQTSITNITPAVLNAESVYGTWIGDDMKFVGFGVTGDNREDSGVKRTTDIPIIDYDSKIIYNYSPTTNICSGDSGGAAFEIVGSNLQLAGINSFGYMLDGGQPICEGGANGTTRVDIHIDWILGYDSNVVLSTDDVPTTTTTTTDTDTTTTTTDTEPSLTVGDGDGSESGGEQQVVTTTTTYGCTVAGALPATGWLVVMLGVVPFIRRRSAASIGL